MIRVAINGFGRIGRTFLRTLFADSRARDHIVIAAINLGPADIKEAAHLFKYDTVMGTFAGNVSLVGSTLVVNNHEITLLTECDPTLLPWKKLAIDWVVEASGRFTKKKEASKHLQAGAKKVLITAPAHDEDAAIILGVNEEKFDANKHAIISLGSCTTNAFMPLLKIIDDAFTIERGFMTTIHAYTPTQELLDNANGNLRRSRAAALNIVPSTTGAMEMLGKVMPHLASKIQGGAVRVPVAKVSLVDLSVITQKPMTIDAIHEAAEKQIKERLKGYASITREELVSSDFSGNAHSVILDAPLTSAQGTQAKVYGWYDNEWGYSERVKDFLLYVSR